MLKGIKKAKESGYVYAPYIMQTNIEVQGSSSIDLSRYSLNKHKDRQLKIQRLLNSFKDDEITELKKEIEKLKNGRN